MSDFPTLETSVESSRPIELYRFTMGSEEFFFTSAEDDIVVDGDTYVATAISRNKIAQGADSARATLQVTLPSTEALTRKFIVISPAARGEFSLFRYQRDESPAFDTRVLLFEGIIQSVKFSDDGQLAEIAIRTLESALARNIPRFTYLGMCNHFLYDESCGVDPSLFNHIGEVTLVDGFDITVTGAGASGFDLKGGYCRPTGEADFRTVFQQTGDVLTLNEPFGTDPTGANVQCFAGCDHLIGGDCALVFDNVAEFGGFAWVPEDNIYRTGIKV